MNDSNDWSSLGLFHFSILGLQNLIPWGLLFALCSGLQSTHLHAKNDTFQPVNTDIQFLHKICYILVYNMFCFQFDTNLAPIPWTIRRSLDFCFAEYEKIIIIENFNTEVTQTVTKVFCDSYELRNLVKNVTCYKSPENP